jgi:SAM-dependent methyltransferase
VATSDWDRDTLRARIQDAGARIRHPGGSPDPTEVAAYEAALPAGARDGTALILGMTPELRRLALRRFRRVVSVDANPGAIDLYRDWIDAKDRARERIVRADWLDLTGRVAPVSAVLGDGVFGNLLTLAAHRRLLRQIARLLQPGGRFITRQALIPNGFDPAAHRADRLLRRFRRGAIDAGEFGFGIRLVGYLETCYDGRRYLLDNARVFRRCDDARRQGVIREDEYAAIRRYYYGGRNCILPQDRWERLLAECGYRFDTRPCRGKAWYAYYVIYACERDKAARGRMASGRAGRGRGARGH